MCSDLKCYNIEKHAEFYLGHLWFDVTSIGNAAYGPPVVNILPHAQQNIWRHFCNCGRQ
jgi:hypothetical protein